MGKQDDYIENETELAGFRLPLLPSYKMAKPFTLEEELSLRLEMQEEVAFQKRSEKEQVAILKIKNILEKRIQANYLILRKIKKTDQPVDQFLKYCIYPDFYLKQSTKEKNKTKSQLNFMDLEKTLIMETRDLECILDKIYKNTPYLLEALYIEFDQINFSEQKSKNELFYKKLHTLAIDFALGLKIISPFLTEEFDLFFDHSKTLPIFHRNESNLTPEEILLNNYLIFDFIPSNLRKTVDLCNVTKARIKKYSLECKQPLDDLWSSLLKIIHQINPISHQRIGSQKKLNEYLNSEPGNPSGDLSKLPYWEETRLQFGEIHQCFKQLEQINRFLDSLEKDLKASTLEVKSSLEHLCVPMSEERVKKEVVEGVPPLDAVFLPPVNSDKSGVSQREVITQFLNRKKIQLQLWQERIQERKVQQSRVQKEAPHSAQSEREVSEMSFEVANQLFSMSSSMDKDSLLILNSFFKQDNRCKPQNILFQQIQKLIKQVGGVIQFSGSGSSHFSISLPNTYLDSPNNLKVMGGSYRPHSGDEWTTSAHELCKNAFVKAGITPERIEIAEEMSLRPQGIDGDSPKRAFKA